MLLEDGRFRLPCTVHPGNSLMCSEVTRDNAPENQIADRGCGPGCPSRRVVARLEGPVLSGAPWRTVPKRRFVFKEREGPMGPRIARRKPRFVTRYVHYLTGKVMVAADYGYKAWPLG